MAIIQQSVMAKCNGVTQLVVKLSDCIYSLNGDGEHEVSFVARF